MRNATLDLAKGFAILLMVQVHLMEVFAKNDIKSGLFGQISLFFGATPVAPLFLIILGYFLAQTQKTFRQLIFRSLIILVVGILLNISLNAHLLLNIFNHVLVLEPWRFIFGIDILFVAGLSIMVIAILRLALKKNILAFLLVCVMILLITPYVTENLPLASNFRYLLAYIGGQYNWSYFPLFPWLAYPLWGYTLYLLQPFIQSYMQKQTSNLTTKKQHLVILFVATLVTVLTLDYGISIVTDLKLYYHHSLGFFLWNISFLTAWIILLNLLHMDLGNSSLFRYIKWLGRNVTLAYVFQWLIIGNIGTAVYKTFELSQLIISYFLILLMVSILLFVSAVIKQEFLSQKTQ